MAPPNFGKMPLAVFIGDIFFYNGRQLFEADRDGTPLGPASPLDGNAGNENAVTLLALPPQTFSGQTCRLLVIVKT